MDVLRKRMGPSVQLRFDLIGVLSVHGDADGTLLAGMPVGQGTDVRMRAAMRHDDPLEIDRLHREFTGLWLAGPAGGGGVRASKRQRLSSISCLVPREHVPERFYFLD